MLRLQIQKYEDRKNVIIALANSGYAVRVKEEMPLIGVHIPNYFVELLDFEGKEIIKDCAWDKILKNI